MYVCLCSSLFCVCFFSILVTFFAHFIFSVAHTVHMDHALRNTKPSHVALNLCTVTICAARNIKPVAMIEKCAKQ